MTSIEKAELPYGIEKLLANNPTQSEVEYYSREGIRDRTREELLRRFDSLPDSSVPLFIRDMEVIFLKRCFDGLNAEQAAILWNVIKSTVDCLKTQSERR